MAVNMVWKGHIRVLYLSRYDRPAGVTGIGVDAETLGHVTMKHHYLV